MSDKITEALEPFGAEVVSDWLREASRDLARLDGYPSSRSQVIYALAAALSAQSERAEVEG